MNGPSKDVEAMDIAREAHELSFSSRRGTGEFCQEGRLIGFYLWDNNPFRDTLPLDAPGSIRGLMYAKLEAALSPRGCKLVSKASYPLSGDAKGYTLGMIFVGPKPFEDRAIAGHILNALINEAHATLCAMKPEPMRFDTSHSRLMAADNDVEGEDSKKDEAAEMRAAFAAAGFQVPTDLTDDQLAALGREVREFVKQRAARH